MRRKERINYQIFHSSGEKVQVATSTMSNDDDEKLPREMIINDLVIQINIIKDDISDFIDEISYEMTSAEDVTSRLETLRTSFRAKHYKLRHYVGETYDEIYLQEFETVINHIKSAIRRSKDVQSKERVQKKVAVIHQERAMLFQVETTTRVVQELEKNWQRDIKEASDDKLIVWKETQEDDLKKFNQVTEKYQELLKFPASSEDLVREIEYLGKRYTFIVSLKEEFNDALTNEIDQRELNKRDLVKETKLNIKLSKFSGYDSELDIYTFQSEFEKLYLRTTTKRMLPDLLINNHLSEPALSLVKHLDNICEIWDRLKGIYGDTKILLSKKIASLDKINSFNKSRDPEKIIAGISQLINLMRDLICLASKHDIDKYLYYGDALD